MAESEILKIEDLVSTYVSGEEEIKLRALDGISLEVKRGSFVAVIGQNGSGKSTLAKNINALLIPDEGDVIVSGINTKDESRVIEIRKSAGMLFQNPDNQLVSTIVEDDVAFGPENLGIDPAEIRLRVDEALKDVGMYEFRDSAPHNLSGGQKQRIAIAGIVAMRPDLIVFDEPTAMLDPKGRRDVMSIIHKLNGEGITCVLITHFMEEAAEADRIIVISKGKIVMDGSPEEIFARPAGIRELGLDVPAAVDIADRLRQKGFDVPFSIIREEELADWVLE